MYFYHIDPSSNKNSFQCFSDKFLTKHSLCLLPELDAAASAKFKVSTKNFFVFVHKRRRKKNTLCPFANISKWLVLVVGGCGVFANVCHYAFKSSCRRRRVTALSVGAGAATLCLIQSNVSTWSNLVHHRSQCFAIRHSSDGN